MANLVIPRRELWTRQPHGPFDIDWGNPLTRDLKFVFTGSDLAEKVSKKLPTLTNFIKKPTASGIGYVQTGAGSMSYSMSPLTGGACTLVSRFYFKPSASIYTECVSQILPTGNTSRAGLYANIDDTGNIASGHIAMLVRLDATSQCRAAIYGVSEGWHTVVVAWNGGSVISIWLDGTPTTVTQNNIGSLSSFFATGQGVRISGNGANDNPVVFGAGIGRLVSDAEAKAISGNPWQIFAPRETRLFVPVGGGGTTTVTSDSSAAYKVQGSIQASSVAAYGIRSAVSSDASATYNILSATSVSASASAGYNIRGGINQATSASYALRGAVTQDTSAAYSILPASAVSSSVTAGYAIKGSVQSSIIAGYSIDYASSGFIRAPSGSGPTVIQAGSYRPSNTGGRRY